MAPAHGGFYVNCGRLEYKARESADENSDLDAVIEEGEKAAAIQKRKYVRKRKKGDDVAAPSGQQQNNSGKEYDFYDLLNFNIAFITHFPSKVINIVIKMEFFMPFDRKSVTLKKMLLIKLIIFIFR